MPEIWMLYSTFATRDEALSVARALVEAGEVACANVLAPMTAVYRWQGETRQEEEAVLVAKTTRERAPSAIAAIKKRHPYAVPCIVSWPLAQGFPPFLQWVADEVKKG